jgi:hypothetical protein
MRILTIATVTYCSEISEEDAQKVRDAQEERPDDSIEDIVWDLWLNGDLNLYENSYDVDCSTEEIQKVEDD